MADNIIYNAEKLRRVVSFAGLPHVGSKSPTDLDAPAIPFVLEDGDQKKYMVGDFKEWEKGLSTGQRLLLERQVRAFSAIGYVAIAFVAWHWPFDDIIDAARCLVVSYYAQDLHGNGIWIEDRKGESLLIKYKRFFNVR